MAVALTLDRHRETNVNDGNAAARHPFGGHRWPQARRD
jgi:hypothetical protein